MCVLVCFNCTFNLFMCLIIKQLQLYLHFVSFRFVSLFRFASFLCFVSLSFALLELVKKYCVFGRFFGRFARFLVISVCLSVPTQKAVILAVFARQIFDAPPAPYRPPPRPRLPFRIIFFIFFLFRPQPSVCQPSKFFFVFFSCILFDYQLTFPAIAILCF